MCGSAAHTQAAFQGPQNFVCCLVYGALVKMRGILLSKARCATHEKPSSNRASTLMDNGQRCTFPVGKVMISVPCGRLWRGRRRASRRPAAIPPLRAVRARGRPPRRGASPTGCRIGRWHWPAPGARQAPAEYVSGSCLWFSGWRTAHHHNAGPMRNSQSLRRHSVAAAAPECRTALN